MRPARAGVPTAEHLCGRMDAVAGPGADGSARAICPTLANGNPCVNLAVELPSSDAGVAAPSPPRPPEAARVDFTAQVSGVDEHGRAAQKAFAFAAVAHDVSELAHVRERLAHCGVGSDDDPSGAAAIDAALRTRLAARSAPPPTDDAAAAPWPPAGVWTVLPDGANNIAAALFSEDDDDETAEEEGGDADGGGAATAAAAASRRGERRRRHDLEDGPRRLARWAARYRRGPRLGKVAEGWHTPRHLVVRISPLND